MKSIICKLHTVFLIAIVVTVFAGCGGGSDGGGSSSFSPPSISTTPITLSADNENDIADAAFETVDDTSNLGGVTDDLFKAGGNGQFNIVGLATKQIQNVLVANQQQKFVGAQTVSGTENCAVSGTVAITISTAQEFGSQSFAFTAGDYFSLSTNSCNDGDGEVTSGSVTITINSANLTNFTIVFDNFRITDSEGTDTVHGDITLASSLGLDSVTISSSYTLTISGDSLYVIESGGQSFHLTDYSIATALANSEYTVVASFTLDGSDMNGRVTLTANLVGVVDSEYPSAGSTITVTAENGTLTAEVLNSTQVSITLDIDGTPGADDGYPKTVTWEELEAV